MTFVNTAIVADGLNETVQSPFEREMARLIVDALQLDIAPDEIAPRDALFNEGLGLDSIDALELALAISKRFGVELKSDDARNGEVFASLRNLAIFVAFFRKDAGAATGLSVTP